jgi:hypothetical protein
MTWRKPESYNDAWNQAHRHLRGIGADDYDQAANGDQLSFDHMGVEQGATYRNKHSGYLAVVVSVEQKRRQLVTYRSSDRDNTTDLPSFLEHWQRCRPSGQVL